MKINQIVVPPIINERPSPDDYTADEYRLVLRNYYRTVASERQNHRCCYCGRHLNLKMNIDPRTNKIHKPNSTYTTVDHIECKGRGGEDHVDNYVAVCYRDNQYRGSIPVDEFLELITESNLKNIPLKTLASEARRMYDGLIQVVKESIKEECRNVSR